MGRPSGLAAAILVAAGIVQILAGAAAFLVGRFNPGLISSRLPPEAAVDAPAVGGAAVALGVATAVLGVVHLVTAIGVRRGSSVAATGGVVLAATMAVLAFGSGVAAVVSIASGAALAIYMVPAATCLGAAVIGYAMVIALILRTREAPI